jgi:uncharacterized protein
VTEWSKDLVLYRMTRADESLEDARILAKAERWNACVNRLYYACFYGVSALLVINGFPLPNMRVCVASSIGSM